MMKPQSFINAATILLAYGWIVAGGRESSPDVIEIAMPGVQPTQDDHYLCTFKNIEEYGTQYITAFMPNSNADRAHHMILFTCDDIEKKLAHKDWWDCGHHYRACDNMRIVYAWAKNAPPTVLPDNVGFRIGAEANIKNLVLQVHYAHPMPVGSHDHSGFKVKVTHVEPKYLAGIFLLFRGVLEIPPKTDKIHGDMNCPFSSPAPIHPFAYRVHTHTLGVVVSGYTVDSDTGDFDLIGKGNPQWPQAFYPINKNITIQPRQFVAARCTYSTLNFEKPTRIGQTAGDEMCNLYIMFYTASRDPEDHYVTCMNEVFPELSNHFPSDSDTPLPRNKTLEEHAKSHSILLGDSVSNKAHSTKKRPGAISEPPIEQTTLDDNLFSPLEDARVDNSRKLKLSDYKQVSEWPNQPIRIGQTSGVDFDTHGNVVIFHRGDRVWGASTFNIWNQFTEEHLGPINVSTVLIVDPVSGKSLHDWGKDMFYMPHGITVDQHGNFWLTDVALHQVFKFEPGSNGPSMVLGTRFKPGNDDSHFCKPSAVAVMSNGDFFVADGYCNSRIIKFNSLGQKILQWGRPYKPSFASYVFRHGKPPYAFQIPHALALAESRELLFVADRENGRVQCFHTGNGSLAFIVDSPAFGRLFSVAYSDVNGGTLYAINGPGGKAVQGFIIPLSTRKISSVFKPENQKFGNPHDLAVSRDGSQIYVVEISKPYRVWKFVSPQYISGKKLDGMPQSKPQHYIKPLDDLENSSDDSFGASIIIMALLTIPLLLLIAVGAIMRLLSSGWCRRRESKTFSEFFPPSAGFEKLRMEESDSENSDTDVEEFTVSSYRLKT